MTGATHRPDRPDPLDDDLGWMLGIVFRGYVRAAEHALTDFPGGPRGYQLLTAAINGPARNQGAIAEEIGIDRTVLTYLIDDLERPGFVARRADPADRRNRLIEVTDAGRASLGAAAIGAAAGRVAPAGGAHADRVGDAAVTAAEGRLLGPGGGPAARPLRGGDPGARRAGGTRCPPDRCCGGARRAEPPPPEPAAAAPTDPRIRPRAGPAPPDVVRRAVPGGPAMSLRRPVSARARTPGSSRTTGRPTGSPARRRAARPRPCWCHAPARRCRPRHCAGCAG